MYAVSQGKNSCWNLTVLYFFDWLYLMGTVNETLKNMPDRILSENISGYYIAFDKKLR